MFSGKEVAKTVAVCPGKRVLLGVLLASSQINLEKLSSIVGEKVVLMGEQECNETFPDCEAGAIPPFGELYGVPVYMEKALAEDSEIVLGAGTLSESALLPNVSEEYLL
jgi:Ala-tRNA(Pro) deacylase